MGNECPFSVLSSWDRKEGRKEGRKEAHRFEGRGRTGAGGRVDVRTSPGRSRGGRARAGTAADCDNVAENKLGLAARPRTRPSVRPPITSEALHKQVLLRLGRSVGRSVDRAWDSTLQIGMREEFAEDCEWPSRIADYAEITMNRPQPQPPPPRRRLNPETALHARSACDSAVWRGHSVSLARSLVPSFGESSSELSRR